MDQDKDPRLSRLLKEWKVDGAPRSLEERVLGPRPPWWRFLFTGSVRLPVPAAVAAALVLFFLGVYLARDRQSSAQVPASISLKDFRPVAEPSVRIIRSVYANQ